MIDILIALLIVIVVLALVSWIVREIAMPQPLRTGILITAFVLCILWLLQRFGVV